MIRAGCSMGSRAGETEKPAFKGPLLHGEGANARAPAASLDYGAAALSLLAAGGLDVG